jgi:hypothetical protein
MSPLKGEGLMKSRPKKRIRNTRPRNTQYMRGGERKSLRGSEELTGGGSAWVIFTLSKK